MREKIRCSDIEDKEMILLNVFSEIADIEFNEWLEKGKRNNSGLKP